MTDPDLLRAYIYGDILTEIHRQDLIWGNNDNSFADWIVILGEEYGEVCKEVFELRIADNLEDMILHKEYLDTELVQVASVCFRIIEKIRNKNVNS